tara:strand:+ start:27821 stop:29290 length:1470 start_codon:yes stop_codon:yes gene_type:complete
MLNHKKLDSINEETIYKLDDNNIVFNDYLYKMESKIINSQKRYIETIINDTLVKLKRVSSFIYEYENIQYIAEGNYIYKKSEPFNKDLSPNILNKNNKIDSIDFNSIIEGNNLPVLKFLLDKYKNTLDLICIDPPYNTKNPDMKYFDYFHILEDGDKHSSWLSFMKKRLDIAIELLSEDGLIFINIDEYEYPYLKILCDDIFLEDNLIETFIWQKNSTKNNSKTTSNNHEYILCYAKNKKIIEKLKYFRIRKEGISEIENVVNNIKNSNTNNKKVEIEKSIREYYKNNKHLKGIKQYKFVDENLNVYRISDVSAPNGSGLKYDIKHPITGKICKQPAGGFRYNKKTIEDHIINNRFHFGKDEKTVPQFKRYLSDMETEVVKSVIPNFDEGKKDLEKIFGQSPFNNSKPVSLLKYIINMLNKEQLNCLDFFAGSGSFGQAVLENNQEKNRNDNFILITNNENNIFYDVLEPRVKFFDKNIKTLKLRYIIN